MKKRQHSGPREGAGRKAEDEGVVNQTGENAMTNMTKAMNDAKKYLDELLDSGVDANEAIMAAASRAANNGESYADAKQTLAFVRFGFIA